MKRSIVNGVGGVEGFYINFSFKKLPSLYRSVYGEVSTPSAPFTRDEEDTSGRHTSLQDDLCHVKPALVGLGYAGSDRTANYARQTVER